MSAELFNLEIELLEVQMSINYYDDSCMKIEPGTGSVIQFYPDWYRKAKIKEYELISKIILIKKSS